MRPLFFVTLKHVWSVCRVMHSTHTNMKYKRTHTSMYKQQRHDYRISMDFGSHATQLSNHYFVTHSQAYAHAYTHTLSLTHIHIHPFIRIQSCRPNAAAAATIFVLDAKAVSIWVLSAFVYIHTTHFTHHILASFFRNIFHTASVRTAFTHIHICQNHFSQCVRKVRRAVKSHFISQKSPVKESDSIVRDSGE